MTDKLTSTLQAQVAALEQDKAMAIETAIRENEQNVVQPKQQELAKEMTDKITALNAEYAAKEAAIKESYTKAASDLAAREKAAVTYKVGAEYDTAIAKIKAIYE